MMTSLSKANLYSWLTLSHFKCNTDGPSLAFSIWFRLPLSIADRRYWHVDSDHKSAPFVESFSNRRTAFIFSNVFIECEFSGVAGSQQEFGWCTGDFGKSAHPASVPGGGPAHQSDGSKSWKSDQTHKNPRSSRWWSVSDPQWSMGLIQSTFQITNYF